MNPSDVDAYLQRIGHTGSRAPTLDTLAAVHGAHVSTIAFENLDPLLGRTVSLDAEALQRKLVNGGRGGYCYEHNLLFGEALRRLGFTVTNLAARVIWGAPEGTVRPRTHMLLLVSLGAQRYVVDAGFGGLTLTAPLQLDRRAPQATPHGPFRLLHAQGDYVMQAELRGQWSSLYVFDLQPQQRVDYELTSWYLCNYPASHFRQSLLAARPASYGRHALLDNQLTFHPLRGESETRLLTSAAEMRQALEEHFLLDLSGIEGVDARLEAIAARPQPAPRAPAH